MNLCLGTSHIFLFQGSKVKTCHTMDPFVVEFAVSGGGKEGERERGGEEKVIQTITTGATEHQN